jgi:hypothetical protein
LVRAYHKPTTSAALMAAAIDTWRRHVNKSAAAAAAENFNS